MNSKLSIDTVTFPPIAALCPFFCAFAWTSYPQSGESNTTKSVACPSSFPRRISAALHIKDSSPPAAGSCWHFKSYGVGIIGDLGTGVGLAFSYLKEGCLEPPHGQNEGPRTCCERKGTTVHRRRHGLGGSRHIHSNDCSLRDASAGSGAYGRECRSNGYTSFGVKKFC